VGRRFWDEEEEEECGFRGATSRLFELAGCPLDIDYHFLNVISYYSIGVYFQSEIRDRRFKVWRESELKSGQAGLESEAIREDKRLT